MKRVFLDTNVLLDVLLHRRPGASASAAVWTLAENGKIRAAVSAISFPSVFYILGRAENRDVAIEGLRILRAVFEVVACDVAQIDQALAEAGPDFEDDVQLCAAGLVQAEVLLTRNPSHFRHAAIPVMSPEEFLAVFHESA